MEIDEENLFQDRTEEEVAKDKPVKQDPEEKKDQEKKDQEEYYTPHISDGRKEFKEGDNLDPRIRTDSDGKIWLKLKDN